MILDIWELKKYIDEHGIKQKVILNQEMPNISSAHSFHKEAIHMKNEEYIKCIIRMLQEITDNEKLKMIFEFVHRIFL